MTKKRNTSFFIDVPSLGWKKFKRTRYFYNIAQFFLIEYSNIIQYTVINHNGHFSVKPF
jgi:hypothetical protein